MSLVKLFLSINSTFPKSLSKKIVSELIFSELSSKILVSALFQIKLYRINLKVSELNQTKTPVVIFSSCLEILLLIYFNFKYLEQIC